MDVKTAARVFRVLNLFAEVRTPLIYSEIAQRLELPLSSCHALLKTMVACGYLYEPGIRSGYYPTQRLLHVAQAICSADPLISLFAPILAELRDATRETAVLAKLADDQVVYLSVVESNQMIRYAHEPGGFKALHATASGKALLGALDFKQRKKLLDSYERWDKVTASTIVDRKELEAEVEEGLRRGWHHSFGENVDDVAAIAQGFLLCGEAYSLVVAGPLHRIQRNEHAIAGAISQAKLQIPENLLSPIREKPEKPGLP